MFYWRCVVYTLLFLACVAVFGFADAARAEAFFEREQADPRARVFFQCTDRLQRDIELGLQPGLSDQQARVICSERTEGILESLRDRGLAAPPAPVFDAGQAL